MSTNPFDAVIAQAAQLEAEQEAARQAAAKLRKEQRQAEAADRRQEQLRQRRKQFGEGFLYAVARKVANPKWSSSYILEVKAYSEALLCQTDQQLPTIDERHAEMIFDKFAYGLSMERNQGLFPEGFLFGQRLLAERQASEQTSAGEVGRLRYTAPSVDDIIDQPVDPRPRQQPVYTTSSTVEPGPAITPRKKRDRRPKSARTSKNQLTAKAS